MGSNLFLAVYGLSAGLLVSAGIFTVLLAVGLTPRFVGTTHTAKKIFLYEECITAGAAVGTLFSAIPAMMHAGEWVRSLVSGGEMSVAAARGSELLAGNESGILAALDIAGELFLGVAGLFMGMFVGCLALAIAEMLNSIPIFARRTSFRHGLGIAVLAVALGKLAGSLFYFWRGDIFPG